MIAASRVSGRDGTSFNFFMEKQSLGLSNSCHNLSHTFMKLLVTNTFLQFSNVMKDVSTSFLSSDYPWTLLLTFQSQLKNFCYFFFQFHSLPVTTRPIFKFV
ncbi:hypothetical protein J6590_054147 [Homalodisca vitripennis]|nr:hypothetical protein J6590_054147 [Homalodisca vitripennis]